MASRDGCFFMPSLVIATRRESGHSASARIGVARKLFGISGGAEGVIEETLADLRRLGAVLVDPADLPSHGQFGAEEFEVMLYEFKAGLNTYLAGRGPGVPVKNLADQATKTDGSVSRHSAARTERPEKEAPKRNMVLYVVLGAVLLGVVLTAGRMMTPKEPATVTVPSAAATPEVSVLVSVSPADAVVFVDDKPTANPAVTTLREGSEHTVRAEAPGHAPKTTTFKATRDARVVLALEKDKAEPTASASASASAASAPSAKAVPAGTAAPRPTGAATVKKDCSSPYFLDQDGVKRFKPECL